MIYKTAIVTGGGSGTGREVARKLTEAGVDVEVWGRDEGRLRSAVDEGLAVSHSRVDIGDPDDVTRAFPSTAGRLGPVQVVVHCAGVWTEGNLADVSEVNLSAHILTVISGSVAIARGAVRAFGGNAGHYIQIAAASAKSGYPDTALNTLAKRALDGLHEGLTRELRGADIRLTTIYPDNISASNSPDVEAGTAMTYADVAEAVMFAVRAPKTVDVEEIVLTSRKTGRWE
jgi:NADP-dependent 3-hydroxy acid dehydrogenase YdfG